MGQVVLPVTFVPGTDANAEDVNANFGTVVSEINGNLDNSNIDPAAAIAYSKLALTSHVLRGDLAFPVQDGIGVDYAGNLGANVNYADSTWHNWVTRSTGLSLPNNHWMVCLAGGTVQSNAIGAFEAQATIGLVAGVPWQRSNPVGSTTVVSYVVAAAYHNTTGLTIPGVSNAIQVFSNASALFVQTSGWMLSAVI